jgi:hypothetical protein
VIVGRKNIDGVYGNPPTVIEIDDVGAGPEAWSALVRDAHGCHDRVIAVTNRRLPTTSALRAALFAFDVGSTLLMRHFDGSGAIWAELGKVWSRVEGVGRAAVDKFSRAAATLASRVKACVCRSYNIFRCSLLCSIVL